jgi:hypothetical protein
MKTTRKLSHAEIRIEYLQNTTQVCVVASTPKCLVTCLYIVRLSLAEVV